MAATASEGKSIDIFSRARWHTFLITFASGVGFVLAFPPTGLWPLAWLAPLGWIHLIRQPEPLPIKQIFWGNFLWLLWLFQFIRLPHYAATIGWPLLAAYLSLYPTAFLLLSRVAVHRFRIPAFLVAPVVWVSTELVRGHALTGLSLALLAHSQFRQTVAIQVADLGGAYAVSFVMMLFSGLIYESIRHRKHAPSAWGFATLAALLIGAIASYGMLRISQHRESLAATQGTSPSLHVALLQGSVDTEFPDESKIEAYLKKFRDQYLGLAEKARQGPQTPDLIVWPEGMFPYPEFTADLARLGPEASREFLNHQDTFRRLALYANGAFDRGLDSNPNNHPSGTTMLAGLESLDMLDRKIHRNSAGLINGRGELTDRYDKIHPVVFGEFIPGGNWIPAIYQLSPMSSPMTCGKEFRSLVFGDFRLAPSICFESTVPHLIRRQILTLDAEGASPDVLCNLSNDGWFWGSNLLDMHLACNVFRSIEFRIPSIVASNTGISASIDSCGHILAEGPRRQPEVIHATLTKQRMQSPYLAWGDTPFWFCTVCCCLVAISEIAIRVRNRKRLKSRKV